MKLRTYWWGALFIPEDEIDRKALEVVASAVRADPEDRYEEGELTWKHQDDEYYIDIHMPLKWALEVRR